MTTCAVTITNPLGLHARAAAQVRPRGERVSVAGSGSARGDREMDGKSIMGLLLLAAAQGTASPSPPTAPTRATPSRRCARWSSAASTRRHAPDRTRRLARASASARRWCSSAARATCASACRRRWWRASSSGSTRRARGRASSSSRSSTASPTSAGAEHAYLFDAQLLMLDDAMLIDRAAEIIRAERLNAESALRARARRDLRALRSRPRTPTCASARATSATSSDGCA